MWNLRTYQTVWTYASAFISIPSYALDNFPRPTNTTLGRIAESISPQLTSRPQTSSGSRPSSAKGLSGSRVWHVIFFSTCNFFFNRFFRRTTKPRKSSSRFRIKSILFQLSTLYFAYKMPADGCEGDYFADKNRNLKVQVVENFFFVDFCLLKSTEMTS